jgi:surfactin synthase thioesterase subunit
MTSAWFHVLRRSRPAAGRLYCFPHAGASFAAFHPLARAIGEDVELAFASLPGRGPRLDEAPERDLRRLVSALADGIARAGTRDFVLFGHSMGALLSFEVARELRRRGHAPPAALVVSGARPPQLCGGAGATHHDLPRDALVDYVRTLGGTPPQVIDSGEMMDLLLPALRADLEICETYRHVAEPPLPSPVVALFGEEDPDVRPQHVAGWRLHTARGFAIRSFAGGHFFLDRHWPEVGWLLHGLLHRAVARAGEASP